MSKKVKLYEKIIPKYIPNSIVLFFFSIMAFMTGPVKKDIVETHRNENERLLSGKSGKLFVPGRLIENQNLWSDIMFGSHIKSNMSYSGCEIIATYNALVCLGNMNIGLPALISYFERKGVTLKGGFGITPTAPAEYFKKMGYEVKRNTCRKKIVLDKIGDEYNVFLVTFYWNRENIKNQLHTVCISREADGFYIHNNYCRSNDGEFMRQGAYHTLGDAIYGVGKTAAPLVTFAIRRKIGEI
ncbi:hypothetical protein [Butyrivibrio sp. JL13D10]|uniref:hypothetical protein n=1 Tax=Butyrivibrio sp. JL13D10 TaxID=3236815 RepID=UPI0038B61CB8